jgi:cyclopropane-fatty-acyl-phospholipid synthase
VYWRLLTGGSLAAAEAWMDGDWESHQLTPLLQISRATARCWGVWKAAFVCWAPVERLRHWTRRNPAAGAGKYCRPLRPGQSFMPTFWMTTCSTPARCLPTTSRISQAQRAKMARCATSWR